MHSRLPCVVVPNARSLPIPIGNRSACGLDRYSSSETNLNASQYFEDQFSRPGSAPGVMYGKLRALFLCNVWCPRWRGASRLMEGSGFLFFTRLQNRYIRRRIRPLSSYRCTRCTPSRRKRNFGRIYIRRCRPTWSIWSRTGALARWPRSCPGVMPVSRLWLRRRPPSSEVVMRRRGCPWRIGCWWVW